MLLNIKNSSGKIIGTVEKTADSITISTNRKPVLVIANKFIIQQIDPANINHDIVISLYDDYLLTIGEIAAIFESKYFIINNMIKNLPVKTAQKAGRRNSSYGLEFSPERLHNMSISQKGHTPVGYDRTPEIREKISNTLKEKYRSGELIQDKQKKSQAWVDGRYSNAFMGRGIDGYFYSLKNKKDHLFRSLFELYFLILLEADPNVKKYETEPFQIQISSISIYIPDILVNDNLLIELKSRNFMKFICRDKTSKEYKRWINEIIAAKSIVLHIICNLK